MMTFQILTALALVTCGSIEISHKNEFNTLRPTQFPPCVRTIEISETDEEVYNEKCINESQKMQSISEDDACSCFQYVLQKTIGLEDEVNFPGRLLSIVFEDYFEQTDKPCANDIVVYTYDENETIMMYHFGIVIDNNTIESLWGSEIRRHQLFNVPTYFGNAAWFYTLKKEYKGPEGKKKAIASIKKCLNLQKKILKETYF